MIDPAANPVLCGCGDVGHHCTYFEEDLQCGCDHLYHCTFTPVGCSDAGLANVVCPDGG